MTDASNKRYSTVSIIHLGEQLPFILTTADEKVCALEDQGSKIYTVEAIEVKENPVPEMVDADRTKGSRLLTGLTGLSINRMKLTD
jgi:hypothetical protein